MGRFVSESNGNRGNYVYVKTNAIELIEKQIHRLLKKDPHPRVAISTVTHPYQGVERKYRLTRGILNTFASHDYQGRVSILSKSPNVLHDLDTLKRIKNTKVGLSITTSDDKLSQNWMPKRLWPMRGWTRCANSPVRASNPMSSSVRSCRICI